MSTIHPISDPLPGEQLLALSPASSEAASRSWRRRPNLIPHRSLTASALNMRQRWAAGIGVLRGQVLTPGVVNGLDVEAIPLTAASGPSRVRISPGQGLTISGEDVTLSRAVEVPLNALPVVLEGSIGDTLESWRTRVADRPQAGVLLLQPVEFERADFDENDPCDRCPCDGDEARLDDWRVVDGARLLWFAWPDDFGRDFQLTPGPLFRNQLAWSVFEAESELSADDALPWERFGVPLALIGLDATLQPSFVDRAAVVRRGGLDRDLRLSRSRDGDLVESWRLAGLWQARIEHLAGHLLELLGTGQDDGPAAVEAAVELWPPCGLLPRWSADLESQHMALFPPGFDLDAVPVPMDELDRMLQDSARQTPLHGSRAERVQVLVPVPGAFYDPRLLHDEAVDPLFNDCLLYTSDAADE